MSLVLSAAGAPAGALAVPAAFDSGLDLSAGAAARPCPGLYVGTKDDAETLLRQFASLPAPPSPPAIAPAVPATAPADRLLIIRCLTTRPSVAIDGDGADVSDDDSDSGDDATAIKANEVLGTNGRVFRAWLPLDDAPNEPIARFFDAACTLVHDALVAGLHAGRTAVVVHCLMGVSRSVTVTLAYLVRRQAALLASAETQQYLFALGLSVPTPSSSAAAVGDGSADAVRAAQQQHHPLTLLRACALVKARHTRARPNDGFLRQLAAWATGEAADSDSVGVTAAQCAEALTQLPIGATAAGFGSGPMSGMRSNGDALWCPRVVTVGVSDFLDLLPGMKRPPPAAGEATGRAPSRDTGSAGAEAAVAATPAAAPTEAELLRAYAAAIAGSDPADVAGVPADGDDDGWVSALGPLDDVDGPPEPTPPQGPAGGNGAAAAPNPWL